MTTHSAQVTMSLPYVTRHAPVAFWANAKTKRELYQQIAENIRRYATKHGISPRAVEYSAHYA